MPQFLVVGAGAALGAAARYLLSVALGGGMIPLLIINILGSALMGYFRPSPFGAPACSAVSLALPPSLS